MRLTEISANDEASAQFAAGLSAVGLTAAELFGEPEPATRPARRAADGRREAFRRAQEATAGSGGSGSDESPQGARTGIEPGDPSSRRRGEGSHTADTTMAKAAAAVRNAERQLEHAQEGLAAADTDRDDAARRLSDAEDAVNAAERALDPRCAELP